MDYALALGARIGSAPTGPRLTSARLPRLRSLRFPLGCLVRLQNNQEEIAMNATAEVVPMLVAGRWAPSRSERQGPVHNPSTGRVIANVPLATAAEVDVAVKAAAAALPAWSETPVVDRARVFFRFREKLEAHSDELARLVTREHGKTLAEARASV